MIWGSTSVYVIRQAEGPYLKVGMANDVHKRLKQMQGGNPHDLTITHVSGPHLREIAAQIEYRAHTLLRPYHVRREWFSCSVDDAVRAIQDATKYVRNRRGNVISPTDCRTVNLGRPRIYVEE